MIEYYSSGAPRPDTTYDELSMGNFLFICAQTDPEVFHPEEGESSDDAVRVCAGCSVARICLDNALEKEYEYGIFAGTDQNQRQDLLQYEGEDREAAISAHFEMLVEKYGDPTQRAEGFNDRKERRNQYKSPTDLFYERFLAAKVGTSFYELGAQHILGSDQPKKWEKLPSKHNLEIVQMAFRDGFSFSHIGQRFSISPDIIGDRVRTIKAKLAELPEEIRDHVLDIRPIDEVLRYDIGSEEYNRSVRRLLGLNALRPNGTITQEGWIEIVHGTQGSGDAGVLRPLQYYADQYGLHHYSLVYGLKHILPRIESLPDEVKRHVLGLPDPNKFISYKPESLEYRITAFRHLDLHKHPSTASVSAEESLTMLRLRINQKLSWSDLAVRYDLGVGLVQSRISKLRKKLETLPPSVQLHILRPTL